MALADPLRATAGTRPGRELLPWHLPHRPRNRASPIHFPPQFGRALYPARDSMALQSLPGDPPVPPRQRPGAAAALGGRAAPRGGRPAGSAAGDGRGEGAEEGAPRAAPPATQVRCPTGGHCGELRPSAPGSRRPHGEFPRRRGKEGAPAASSSPPSSQLRPDGDPSSRHPRHGCGSRGTTLPPRAPRCSQRLETFLLRHLHPAAGTARPPHYPRPHTYARQAVRSAPRFRRLRQRRGSR